MDEEALNLFLDNDLENITAEEILIDVFNKINKDQPFYKYADISYMVYSFIFDNEITIIKYSNCLYSPIDILALLPIILRDLGVPFIKDDKYYYPHQLLVSDMLDYD